MKILRGVINIIVRIVNILLPLLIGGLVLVIFSEMLYRSVLNRSFRSAVEISSILFIWMIFLGLIHLYDQNKMLRFEILTSRVNKTFEHIFWYFGKLVCLGLGVVMVISYRQMYPFVSTQFYATMRWLPLTMHYLPIALAGAFFVLKSIEELITRTLWLASKTPAEVATQEGG